MTQVRIQSEQMLLAQWETLLALELVEEVLFLCLKETLLALERLEEVLFLFLKQRVAHAQPQVELAP
jgi:hypothetical protein